MRTLLAIVALCVMTGGLVERVYGEPQDNSAVVGTWEGEAKCMVPGSPCHDEHVIYAIAEDEKTHGLKIDAFKVADGEKQLMGTLSCRYNAEKKNLSCTGGNPQMKGDWEYSVSGDAIEGTLVIGDEHKLYRKMSLKRKSG